MKLQVSWPSSISTTDAVSSDLNLKVFSWSLEVEEKQEVQRRRHEEECAEHLTELLHALPRGSSESDSAGLTICRLQVIRLDDRGCPHLFRGRERRRERGREGGRGRGREMLKELGVCGFALRDRSMGGVNYLEPLGSG